APTLALYTLSLHDALPILLIAVDVGTSGARASAFEVSGAPRPEVRRSYPTFLPAEGWAEQDARRWQSAALSALGALVRILGPRRSEEHTSELQSPYDLVCR